MHVAFITMICSIPVADFGKKRSWISSKGMPVDSIHCERDILQRLSMRLIHRRISLHMFSYLYGEKKENEQEAISYIEVQKRRW